MRGVWWATWATAGRAARMVLMEIKGWSKSEGRSLRVARFYLCERWSATRGERIGTIEPAGEFLRLRPLAGMVWPK